MLKFHAFRHVSRLPRADKRIEQVGTLSDHLDSESRAPRVTRDENFILVPMVLQEPETLIPSWVMRSMDLVSATEGPVVWGVLPARR
jgi:hypothetical protein